MTRITLCIAVLLLLPVSAVAQDEPERYVAKRASVALLQAPSPEASILMRLTPGEQVAVLGEQAGFVNVRTVSGLEGWLAASDVTPETPAEDQLITANSRIEELEATVADLQRQLRNARASAQRAAQQLDNSQESASSEVTRLQEELEQVGAELSELRDRNAALEAEIAEYELAEESRRMLARTEAERAKKSVEWRDYWLVIASSALAFLLTGFVSGYALKTRRVRSRFRGLDI